MVVAVGQHVYTLLLLLLLLLLVIVAVVVVVVGTVHKPILFFPYREP